MLEVITPTEVRLTISEGRYHQVKRMFAAVGNHVVGLHRERIGDILLDESLAPGEYRPLTEAEIASVGARSHGVKRDAEAEFFTGIVFILGLLAMLMPLSLICIFRPCRLLPPSITSRTAARR